MIHGKLKTGAYQMPDYQGKYGDIRSLEYEENDSTLAGRVFLAVLAVACGLLVCYVSVELSHALRQAWFAMKGGMLP